MKSCGLVFVILIALFILASSSLAQFQPSTLEPNVSTPSDIADFWVDLTRKVRLPKRDPRQTHPTFAITNLESVDVLIFIPDPCAWAFVKPCATLRDDCHTFRFGPIAEGFCKLMVARFDNGNKTITPINTMNS